MHFISARIPQCRRSALVFMGIMILAASILPGCETDYKKRYPLPENVVPGKLLRLELGSFYLPRNYSPDKQYPLVVLLHGLGSTDEIFLYSNSFIDQAEKRGYILCAAKSKRTFWDEEPPSPDIENIQRMILAMRAHFPIRDDKICLFGFSAGSHFTHTMLLFNKTLAGGKKLFTAFVAGSGGSGFLMDQYRERDYMPEELKIPGYIFWGEREVPHPGEEMAAFLKKHDWDITVWTHPGQHSIDGNFVSLAFDWLDKKIP